MTALSLVRVFTLVLAFVALPSFAFAQADRGGFTLLVNGGLGIQSDSALEESAFGVGGINFGAGAFVTPKLAILGRFSGTTVDYEFYGRQTSATYGGTLQFWPNDRAGIEVGAGVGKWWFDGFDDTGLGLILGTHVTLVNRGKHNLQMGFEYAPVFTTDPVHNISITIGYQLF